MNGKNGWLKAGIAVAALWLGGKFLLPLVLPFLIGGGVALLAEPSVSFLNRHLRLPRLLAAGIGVLLTLALVLGTVGMLGAILLRQVAKLAGQVPDLQVTARQGITVLSDWLVNLTQKAPEGVQPMLTGAALRLLNNGSVLVDRFAEKIPGVILAVLGRVPDSALGAVTGLLAAFMISVRLPRLKAYFAEKLHTTGLDRYLPVLKKARQAALGWLRAQGLLMLLTWLTVSVGFWLLGIRGGILWALLIAVVDAVPMLGTGIILLPWALISFLQGQQAQALGLCALVATATLLRTTLEPRLVGKQLGLDPLVTLICLYAGYRLWDFLGLLLAPMLAGVIFSVVKKD